MIANIVKRNIKQTRKLSTYVEHNYDAIVIGAGGAGLRATMGLDGDSIDLKTRNVIKDVLDDEVTPVPLSKRVY